MTVHISRSFSLALLVTLLCGLIYLVVQQDIRSTANDPQMQMAEDIAARLAAGTAPATVLPLGTVDIATSLSPYVILYNDADTPIASSGLLHGATPAIPAGVFEAARSQENRITWEPEPGVRSAIVVVHYAGVHPGFVVAGRNLREVEKRESMLTLEVGVVWMVSVAMVLWAAVL